MAVDPSGTSSLVTQLKEQLMWLIALGDLKPGDRLPTVHELAGHLRINRNTVAQAYADLRQEGYLVARQRRGTFVADSEVVGHAVQKAALVRVVDDALQRAARMGFSPHDFVQAATARAQIQQALRSRQRALFVECNWYEVRHFTQSLQQELGIAIEGIHLDAVREDPQAFAGRAQEADLVVTTVFHADEIRSVAGPEVEVVAIGAGLQVELLRALAQLPRGSKVAICCLDNDRAARIRTLLVNAGVHHLSMEAIGVDEERRFKEALDGADAVYVSEAAFPRARRLIRHPSRLRRYQLNLDRAGIEMLRVRLAEHVSATAR